MREVEDDRGKHDARMPRATHNAAGDGWNHAGDGRGTGTRSARGGGGYGPTIDTIWTRFLCNLLK